MLTVQVRIGTVDWTQGRFVDRPQVRFVGRVDRPDPIVFTVSFSVVPFQTCIFIGFSFPEQILFFQNSLFGAVIYSFPLFKIFLVSDVPFS